MQYTDRIISTLCILMLMVSCTSTPSGTVDPGGNDAGDGDSEQQFDPIDETLPDGNQDSGFFLDNWQPKEITAPDYEVKSKPEDILDARIQINTNNVITKVPTGIFGNNANPYNGQMGNQSVLIDHLNNLNPNLIRFPGGNLSNVYYWDLATGNKPEAAPPANMLLDSEGNARTNETYWYGNNEASWTMSLDNYYKLLDETNSEGVITANFGYARYGLDEDPVAKAAGYAADWVRYDNGRTTYWEIGNENYGTWQTGYRIDTSKNKDGQPEFISGKLYGEQAKVFIDSMRAAAAEVGTDIKIGTQLIERDAVSYDTDIVRNWNEGYFEAAGDVADYYIIHNYYTPYDQDSPPSVILDSAPEVTADMMQWMNETTAASGAELKPIALTEWNIFAVGSQQMVSDISGMHAAMVLGELIKYEFGMAQRWDLANSWDGGNDHGMFNSPNGSAPGVEAWSPRPDFYHMYYFQQMFGDKMVWSGTQGDDALVSYASTFSSGQVGLVVANTSTSAKVFDVDLKNSEHGDRYYWYAVKGGNEDPYSRKVVVNGQGPNGVAGGPSNYESLKAYSASANGEAGIKLTAPPHSVSYILIDGQ